MATDPYDRDQVAQRRTRRKARASVEQLDLQWLAADARGRRVLSRIMAMTGIIQASYVPGDALTTAFREGQRNIGIQLHAVLTNAGEGLVNKVISETIASDD
ncbi:hypothetical protein LV478_11755 [Komagataeibacter oboediens]|uniref:Bbp19 family protein n=1 Tax=Komagataeibacter oboediens TaxID=65958 RepID=UPI0023DC809E|nr:hypothetical protein [Komagataeibacter oboediens]WEQ51205.1 hypothetical protein LV478_11755 [Komagataeibacter oboediens]